MSDTAPIRRPRMTSGQRRTVGVGDLISAVSSYGVTKMTDNVNAGDMRKRISVMFVVILGVLSLVYLRVVVLQTWKAGGYREMSVNQRTKSNVIPAEVYLEGTLRSYDPGVRKQLLAEVERRITLQRRSRWRDRTQTGQRTIAESQQQLLAALEGAGARIIEVTAGAAYARAPALTTAWSRLRAPSWR